MARTSIRKASNKSNANLTEIGSTGLKSYAGVIHEEFLRQLGGSAAIKVFAEMRDNDDTVGAVLFIIDKLLRNVKWKITPANTTPDAMECAEFMESCMHDMEHSWSDFISEILSMLVFGWSTHEIVYKIRGGLDNPSPTHNSSFDDGKVGWRKLPIRSQETLYRWLLSEAGDIEGMEQLPDIGKVVTIPANKMLLFRTQSYKNNPMGRSILRNAYRAWFFKKRIEEIEGVGIERDLAGLPCALVPAELLSGKATPEQRASLDGIKKLVKCIRRDEQEGVVFPLVYDDNGNKLYELSLLSTGGTRQFDTNAIIARYSKSIAMSVLADFIFLGQTRVGSYALSSDKTDMFSAGLGAWLTTIADVLNKHARPKLLKLNGYDRKVWGTFKPCDIEKPDVKDFCDNIYKLVGVGALIPDDTVDKKIREMLELDKSENEPDLKPMDFIQQRFEQAQSLLDGNKNPIEPADNKVKPNNPNNKKNPGIEKK